MNMSKQPDKFDTLIDWFLTEAKDINLQQQEMLQKLEKTSEELDNKSDLLTKSFNQLNTQLVEQHRNILSAYKDEKSDRDVFKSQAKSILQEGSNGLTRNILIGCFVLSVIGSLIGSCIAHYL